MQLCTALSLLSTFVIFGEAIILPEDWKIVPNTDPFVQRALALIKDYMLKAGEEFSKLESDGAIKKPIKGVADSYEYIVKYNYYEPNGKKLYCRSLISANDLERMHLSMKPYLDCSPVQEYIKYGENRNL